MNTKTTKTLVFAALIAAMILPFGGMQSVYAAPGDYNLPDGAEIGTHGPPTGDATADKLANLLNTLDFIEGELINCSDPSVLEGLEALKVIVVAAIAELS